jgi:hypothetical protein
MLSGLPTPSNPEPYPTRLLLYTIRHNLTSLTLRSPYNSLLDLQAGNYSKRKILIPK